MRTARFSTAFVALALASGLSGCATCVWMALSPLVAEHGGGDVVALEKGNASFTYPGHPWIGLPPESYDGGARISLMRFDPITMFALVADEGTDATVTNVQLAASALEDLRADASDVRAEEPVPLKIGSLDGLLFEATGVEEETRQRYLYWVSVKNGFYYQLIVTSPEVAELRPIADELFAGFGQLDPTRVSSRISVERFQNHDAEALGFSVDLSEERFATWAPEEQMAAVSVGGTRFDSGTYFAVSTVAFDAARPSSDALLHATLGMLDYGLPETDLERRGARSEGDVVIERYAMQKTFEGDTWEYRMEVRARPEGALLLFVWGSGGDEEVDDTLARVSRAVRFGIPRRDATLDDRQRSVQARLANSIGVHGINARQFSESVPWLERAIKLAPEDATYAGNLFAAYNGALLHAHAVEVYDALSAELRAEPTLRSWAAWHLKELGRKDEALAHYQKLFAGGYDGDEDLVGYVTLLIDAGRDDEGMAVYRAQMKKRPSKEVYVSLSRALSGKDRTKLALDVLDEGEQRLGLTPELAFAKMGIYERNDRFRDVLETCDRLIKGGYASADVFHWQGRSRYSLELYREARESFKKALELRPDDPDAKEWSNEIALLLGESGDLDLEVPLRPVPMPAVLEAELAAATSSQATYPDYGAFYEHVVRAVDVSDDLLRETFYRRIRVTGERGLEDLSTLKWSFDPPGQRIFVNRLEVRDASGALLKQGSPRDYYVIHNREDGAASERRTLHIPLPKLAPGNTVDVVVTRAEPIEAGRLPFLKSRLSATRPVRLSAVSLTGDVKHLEHYARHTEKPRALSGGGYLWTKREPLVLRQLPYSPPWELYAPHVVFGDRRASWSALASTYQDRIKERLAADDDVRRVAKRVVGDARSDDEKLRRIVRYLQAQLKYQALEFGTRGVMPEPPGKTLAQGYGDCKDHAVLLRAMLDASGIRSHLALVHSSEPLERELPSLDQFDHMILFLPGPGGGRFLDATDKELDVDVRVPVGLGDREALVLSSPARVVKLARYDDASSARVNRWITVARGTAYRVKEELVLEGYAANFMRASVKRVDTAAQKGWAQQLLASELPEADLGSISVENLLDTEAPLVVTLEYTTRAGLFERGDDVILALPSLWERYYLGLRGADEREVLFMLRYPFSLESTTRVQAERGLALRATADVKEGRSASARLWTRVRPANDEIVIEVSAQTRPGTFPPAELAKHRDVVEAGLRAARESVHGSVASDPR